MSRVPRDILSTRHSLGLCIVVACDDPAEAAQIGQQISQVHTGTLVTYRRPEDILLNPPAGRLVWIVLAAGKDPATIGKTVAWMRRRWPRCPLTVIGEAGSRAMEVAARSGGATYLTRPVSAEAWAGLVRHMLAMHGRDVTEVRLGG